MISSHRPFLPNRHRPPRRGRAFTLVELLVVMVVLTLMLLMLTELTDNTAVSIGVGNRQVEVDGQARLVLDRIAFDLAGMLQRTDIDYTFNRQTGDDFLSFYAEALSGNPPSGGVAPRTTSLLGYRINSAAGSTNFGRLERGSVDLSAHGITFAPLRNNVFAPRFHTDNSLPVLADADYRLLGDQVFRFEFCYLYRYTDPSSGNVSVALRSFWPDRSGLENDKTALDDIKALVVAIAVLDTKGRTNVTDGQLQILHDGLPDYTDGIPPVNGTVPDIAAVWTDAVNASGYGAGVPNNIRQAVRIYQRYYYLKP